MNRMLETADLRGEVFRTAQAYHAALADYCHAMGTAQDMESPSQVLLGRGVFYYLALSKLLARESSQRLAERMYYLRASQRALSRRYALMQQAVVNPGLPVP
jgi:hypothetical protein